jgi:hypothetical protein
VGGRVNATVTREELIPEQLRGIARELRLRQTPAPLAELDALAGVLGATAGELDRLYGLLNSPEVESFLDGVKREAAHQVERWGAAHDRDKSAEQWFWLVAYLGGKALRAHMEGDRDKALHHTISTAAALAHWHAAISHDTTGRGIGADRDLAAAAEARGQ